MTRIDRYLRRLRQELAKRGVFEARIVDETRDHLADAVEEGLRQGQSVDEAERDALARFGAPELVAAAVPRQGGRPLHHLVVGLSGLTIAAIAWLTLSLVILAPPRANYSQWFVVAALLFVHCALTLAAVAAHWGWARKPVIVSALLMLAMSAWWGYQTMAQAHFEGFRLVLTSLVAVQGALTLVSIRIRSIQ